MPVKDVPSMGWTRRSAGVTVLLVLEEHRKQAGQRLTALLAQRGWTHEDLAHAAGVSVKTVSRFANGRHEARGGTVRALAKALDVPEQAITGPPPPPLGLGHNAEPTLAVQQVQLDRIEAKLDHILNLLGADLQDDSARLSAAVTAAEDAVREGIRIGNLESGTKRRASKKRVATG